jgi:hypothetical protein
MRCGPNFQILFLAWKLPVDFEKEFKLRYILVVLDNKMPSIINYLFFIELSDYISMTYIRDK